MRRGRPGTIFFAAGILLLLAAVLLCGYNLILSRHADEVSSQVATELGSELEEARAENPEPAYDPALPARPGDDWDPSKTFIPDYVLNPNMRMPELEVDGIKYIGLLYIDELGLELPVASEWSYRQLMDTPCRYSGSAYLDNMVILAHNIRRHFGNLKSVHLGSLITFTDADNHVFTYRVADIETLQPTEIEEMTESGYDLTLFTCTMGGRMRIAVRCDREEPVPAELMKQ